MHRCSKQNEELTVYVDNQGVITVVDTESGLTLGQMDIDFCPFCGLDFLTVIPE